MASDEGPENKKERNYSRRKFLAAGGAIAYLWGNDIMDWYLRLALGL